MLIKTKGIVTRALKYRESSVIVDVYTEAKGMRSYIIGGVRKKNARISASLLQPMSLLDLVAYDRDDGKLTRIKELKPDVIFQKIPFEVVRGSVGLFMIELVQKTIKGAEENKPLFDFLHQSFVLLDQTADSYSNLHLFFALELTRFLGFVPDGQFTEETPYFDLREGLFQPARPEHPDFLRPDLSEPFDFFLQSDLAHQHTLSLDRVTRQQLLQKIIQYYRLHIEGMPELNSPKVLGETWG